MPLRLTQVELPSAVPLRLTQVELPSAWSFPAEPPTGLHPMVQVVAAVYREHACAPPCAADETTTPPGS